VLENKKMKPNLFKMDTNGAGKTETELLCQFKVWTWLSSLVAYAG